MIRKLKKLATLTRPETHPEFYDDHAVVAAAVRAGRVRPEFMTPDQLDQIHLPAAQVPGEALTVEVAAMRITHLPFRSNEWWRALQAATRLRLVEILEAIGDEIDHDDPDVFDIDGIIAQNLMQP